MLFHLFTINTAYFVTHSDFPILTLVLAIVIILISYIILVIKIYGIRFHSIKEEIQYTTDTYPSDKHSVLTFLQQTEKDCFVLAYFKKSGEIRPAVYTKYGRKITLLDLRTDTIFYKKICLSVNNDYNTDNVRVRRLRNKSTNTQMVFFASDIDPLDIYIKNRKADYYGSIGKFSVYGMIDDTETVNTNVITINGCEYQLIDNINNNSFINRNEISNT